MLTPSCFLRGRAITHFNRSRIGMCLVFSIAGVCLSSSVHPEGSGRTDNLLARVGELHLQDDGMSDIEESQGGESAMT